MISKISLLLNEQVRPFQEYSVSFSQNMIYCLINDSKERLNELYPLLKSLRSSILTLREIFPDLHIMMVQSNIKSDFWLISECPFEIEDALYEKITAGNDSIIIYPGLPTPSVTTDAFITAGFRDRYFTNLNTQDFAGLESLYEELAHALINSCSTLTGKFLYTVYNELITLFLFYLTKQKITAPPEAYISKLRAEFMNHISVKDLLHYFVDAQFTFLEGWFSKKQKIQSKAVLAAKQYINEHYCDNLTLEIIGREIGLNPSYFSSVFKKETGHNFIDYLTEVRMTKAKTLITETDLEFVEIAEKSGFHDLKYFSKCFRKVTGMSPSSYRKLFS